MGLDWLVQGKPEKGSEKEYYKIKRDIKKLNENRDDNINTISELEEELIKVSITPVDTISDYNEEELEELDEIMTGGSAFTSSFDFRGKGIGLCELLELNLREEAYEDHNPSECIEYAYALEDNLSRLDKDKLTEDEKDDFEFVEKGIKWLKFWGENGHGYYAWY